MHTSFRKICTLRKLFSPFSLRKPASKCGLKYSPESYRCTRNLKEKEDKRNNKNCIFSGPCHNLLSINYMMSENIIQMLKDQFITSYQILRSLSVPCTKHLKSVLKNALR